MSQWNVLNWRDETAYLDCENWDYYRWRWEFIRRRSEYRDDFDRLRTYESNGFRLGIPNSPAVMLKYGYGLLPDPRASFYPYEVLLNDYRNNSVIQTLNNFENLPFEMRTEPSAFATIAFDLRLPLKGQLSCAAEYLASKQKEAGYGTTRHRQDLWPAYLRVLDARESGASWSDIAKIVYLTEMIDKPRDHFNAGIALGFKL